MCVQVCPTGIDIRQGLQYECIACAACIDACDEVMDKVGYPRGLIRYDTQQRPRGQAQARAAAAHDRLRDAARAAGGRLRGDAVTRRNVVGVDVIRDRNALYRERPDGADRERLQRQDPEQGPRGARVPHHGAAACPASRSTTSARPSGSRPAPCRACRCASACRAARLQGGADIRRRRIEATDRPDLTASGKARFIAPTD